MSRVPRPLRAALRPVTARYRRLSTARKMRLRRALYAPLDLFERWTGRRDDLCPPRGLRFVGRGDFHAVGREFLAYFVALGGLRADARVLDVGCGVGRMAVPLTGYLTDRGRYDGFDVVPEAIAWCRGNITTRYPNFHFRRVDVRNRRYNPGGRLSARTFTFPYDDAVFDFVLLTSVLTHVDPIALERYLSEVARVLRPGGTCFVTYFLLEAEAVALLEHGRSELSFRHRHAGFRTERRADPDYVVAFDETLIRDLHRRLGLAIVEPVYYGGWCGRAEHLSYQDIVVARRQRSAPPEGQAQPKRMLRP